MSLRELSQAQMDYVVTTTNARGAEHDPKVSHLGSSELEDPKAKYLNIIGQGVDDPSQIHGYTRKDTAGGLNNDLVTDAFRDLVDKTIEGMLRHF